MTETHVVLGATGALGIATVQLLADEGKTVRAVVRDIELARQILPSRAGIVVNDLSKPEQAVKACDGATVVYDCIGVRYSEWEKRLPGVTANVLAATREAKAKLVFPSTVFGYGPLQKVPATEEHPLAATSKKGRLRNRLEGELMEAHRSGSVPVVIPRFPDFYGPFVLSPLMAPVFEAARDGKTAGWPGALDVPHDLVYIEDAARACIRLAETESAYGRAWHVPGPGPITARRFIEMVFNAAGNPPNMKVLSRRLFRFFGMMIPDAGEMTELLYLFEQPLILDGGAFEAKFPDFQYTPHEEAIRRTVDWFGHH
ncbi:MAG TPA: NAD-dependent epimerase/dehydratase family protein [Chloroflexota bacterium]|nr:NAD-dependent epimerase/dehydratase family protein [Chloroflexota bacterium]